MGVGVASGCDARVAGGGKQNAAPGCTCAASSALHMRPADRRMLIAIAMPRTCARARLADPGLKLQRNLATVQPKSEIGTERARKVAKQRQLVEHSHARQHELDLRKLQQDSQRKTEAQMSREYDPFKPEQVRASGVAGARAAARGKNIEDVLATNTMASIEGFPEAADIGVDSKVKLLHTLENSNVRYDYMEDVVEKEAARAATQQRQRAHLAAQVNEKKRAAAAASKAQDAVPSSGLQTGTAGCGAPLRNPDGTVRTNLGRGLGRGDVVPVDTIHAQLLHEQAEESALKRVNSKHPARETTPSSYDPWEPVGSTRAKVGATKATKMAVTNGVTYLREDGARLVDGSSLSNVMGGPGGGAPVQHEKANVAQSFAEECYRVELQAQRAGESEWGGPGGGAPLRTGSGGVVTARGCAAQDCATGADTARTRRHRERGKIQAEQEEFLHQKAVITRMNKEYDEEDDTYTAQQHSLVDGLSGHASIPANARRPRSTLANNQGDLPASQSALMRRQQYGQYLKAQNDQRRHLSRAAAAKGRHEEMRHLNALAEHEQASKLTRQVNMAAARRAMDPMFARGHEDKVVPRKPRAVVAALSHALEHDLQVHSNAKKDNKSRRLREEVQHARNANRHFGRSGPRLVRMANGEQTARRHVVGDSAAQEYRLLVKAHRALE